MADPTKVAPARKLLTATAAVAVLTGLAMAASAGALGRLLGDLWIMTIALIFGLFGG